VLLYSVEKERRFVRQRGPLISASPACRKTATAKLPTRPEGRRLAGRSRGPVAAPYLQSQTSDARFPQFDIALAQFAPALRCSRTIASSAAPVVPQGSRNSHARFGAAHLTSPCASCSQFPKRFWDATSTDRRGVLRRRGGGQTARSCPRLNLLCRLHVESSESSVPPLISPFLIICCAAFAQTVPAVAPPGDRSGRSSRSRGRAHACRNHWFEPPVPREGVCTSRTSPHRASPGPALFSHPVRVGAPHPQQFPSRSGKYTSTVPVSRSRRRASRHQGHRVGTVNPRSRKNQPGMGSFVGNHGLGVFHRRGSRDADEERAIALVDAWAREAVPVRVQADPCAVRNEVAGNRRW
jgi:hypothetical protein